MEGLKLFIATVEGMQGASDGGVVVDEGMWLRTAPACRLPVWAVEERIIAT